MTTSPSAGSRYKGCAGSPHRLEQLRSLQFGGHDQQRAVGDDVVGERAAPVNWPSRSMSMPSASHSSISRDSARREKSVDLREREQITQRWLGV